MSCNHTSLYPGVRLSEAEIHRMRQHLLAALDLSNGRVPVWIVDRLLQISEWVRKRELERQQVAQAPADFKQFNRRNIGARYLSAHRIGSGRGHD